MLCRHAALCPSDGNTGGQISIFDTGTIRPHGNRGFRVSIYFSVMEIVFFDWSSSAWDMGLLRLYTNMKDL